MAGQGVELCLPEGAIPGDPFGRIAQRFRGQPATMHPAVPLAAQQPGTLQHAQVLRDGRERHGEGRGQLCNRRLPARQPRQDRAPCRIGQRREGGVQHV